MTAHLDIARALDPASIAGDCSFQLDPWQANLMRSAAPRVLLLCSRQSGKSTVCALIAIATAIMTTGALVLLFSPSQRQSGEVFKTVMRYLRQLPGIPRITAESALRCELENGSRIIALPGEERTIRGYSGAALIVIDEAAAIELGKDDAIAPASGGWVVAFVAGDLAGGAALIDRALALNANLAEVWYCGGWMKVWLGEPKLAIERFARAMRLSPLDPWIVGIWAAAHAHFFLDAYDEAASWAAIALRDNPNFQPGLRISAASNAMAGRLEQARNSVARLQELNPGLRVSNFKDVLGPIDILSTSHDIMRPMRNSFVASVANVTLTGRAIDGA
jgi:tetratricopeptide (TPR) repeat protein